MDVNFILKNSKKRLFVRQRTQLKYFITKSHFIPMLFHTKILLSIKILGEI